MPTFPTWQLLNFKVCNGIPARLYRLSFSGELAYEIGVPARYGDALARILMQAGEPFGIVPYGTEALGVMRIEKVTSPATNSTAARPPTTSAWAA